MKSGLFHFKKFSVSHSESSMKVGVDGVLAGAWAENGGTRILDVGTGCGLIALMLAQRFPSARIDAIDIDSGSVEEARRNFESSPWADRLSVTQESFSGFLESGRGGYDLIVSNPPYFEAGVTDFSTARNVARHKGSLSPETLLMHSYRILNNGGRLAMIFPAVFFSKLKITALLCGMILTRATFVKAGEKGVAKRVLAEFQKGKIRPDSGIDDVKDAHEAEDTFPTLVLFGNDGQPTDEYRQLCKDFYLKF